jgi:putative DNA primase/helicase
MKRMGLGKHVQKTCRSPFRSDKKPSWGIFQREGRYFWKDHATGDSGDEITFIVRAKKHTGPGAFPKALEYWQEVADKGPATPVELGSMTPEPPQKPDASGLGPGRDEQLERLANLRKIDPVGLLVAQERGHLVFGHRCGHEVFGVRDSSGHVLEVRRLDGQPFPAFGDLVERKSHAIKGSRKNWPVGIAEAGARPMILLVEGLPDFLAAFEVVVREGALDRVAPVAMLAAGSAIAGDALPRFKGKHIRIVPHVDAAGNAGARRWQEQLIEAGASKVDFWTPGDDDSSPIKDLNDYLPLYRLDTADGSREGRIL